MKVFVTGGAGYVGSHTVVQLLQEGYEVVVVDNLVNAVRGGNNHKPESLVRVEEITGKKITFFDADLLDKNALQQIFKEHKFDCVVHFAALKAVGESCAIPLSYYKNNVGGTTTLLEVMMEHDVKQIVFSSSATVYGNPQYLPLDEKHPVGSGCTNPYGRTKYFIEEILKDVCHANEDWCGVMLRYFNPVGSHESGRIGEDPQGIPNNLMPYIAQVAVGKRKELQVFGNDYNTCDGTGVRDYIHVMDLAAGHVAALKKLGQPGWKVYNLGTGKGYSVLEMVRAFENASGKCVPYKIMGRRVGDVASCYADCSLAEKELGWKAQKTLIEICEDMWRWQSMNPNGFQEKTT